MQNTGEGVGMKLEMSDALMQMVGGFTVIRMLNTFGAAGNGNSMTKEQLLELNAQLNQIKRVD